MGAATTVSMSKPMLRSGKERSVPDLNPGQFYGKGFDYLFPEGGQAKARVPWPQAGKLKSHEDYDPPTVGRMLSKPIELTDVDPRTLSARQTAITREGVSYYMGEEYGKTGHTFADQEQEGNKHPIVYRRSGYAEGPSTNMLLSGHHRATAALLKGEPLKARIVEGGWGPRRLST